jgi:hypothetical protein
MEQRISEGGITGDSGIIEADDNTLNIDKEGLISIIKNNSDKNSQEIDGKILKMIRCFYGHFSYKQMKWVLEKVKYIIRHNDEYQKFKKIDDILFI